MPICCQLADPEHYRAFDWEMRGDAEALDYWLGLFETFPGNIRKRLVEDGLSGDDFEARWEAFVAEYAEGMARRRADPSSFEMSTIALGDFRQGLLDQYGWPDPYVALKRRENALATGMYGEVIARIDESEPAERWELLLRGLIDRKSVV